METKNPVLNLQKPPGKLLTSNAQLHTQFQLIPIGL
jgi:hypothetical protein